MASSGRPFCLLGGSFWSLNIIVSFSPKNTLNFSQYVFSTTQTLTFIYSHLFPSVFFTLFVHNNFKNMKQKKNKLLFNTEVEKDETYAVKSAFF